MKENLKENLLMMMLVPEMLAKAQERYETLRWIGAMGPIGRHLLSVQTRLDDDSIRKHLAALIKEGLAYEEPAGYALTSKGRSLIEPLAAYLMKRPGNKKLEKQLQKLLSMKQVILVRGDSDTSEEVKSRISREAALYMLRKLRDHEVIAVGGGETVAAIPDLLPRLHMNIYVVPACGGFGEKVEHLPNLIAARLADKLGGSYRISHMPDGISPDLIRKLRKEIPEEKEVEKLIARTDLLVVGVNEAKSSERTQSLPEDVKERLRKQNAAGQLLGIYADVSGKILYRLYHTGITLEDIPSIPEVLIAAGGRHKAASILSIARAGVRGVLVTDEGAGQELLKLTSVTNKKI